MKVPFVCEGCSEIICNPENVSENPKYCKVCFEMYMAKKCVVCGKGKKELRYWGECKKCWEESLKEFKKENEIIEKEIQKELKRLENGR